MIRMKNDTIGLLLLYLFTLFLILYFRKQEAIMIALLAIICIVAGLLFQINIVSLLVLTTLFVIVENICVYYNLWKYTTKYPMPYAAVWIYLCWFLAIIFIIKVDEVFKRNKYTYILG